MDAPFPPHPKLTWRAWRRDAVLAVTAFVGIAVLVGGLGGVALLMVGLSSVHVEAKQDTARLDMATIRQSLRRFHEKHHHYPPRSEGLRALVEAGLLETVPVDPWGRPYGYTLQGGWPVLWCDGADGLPGGAGADADIFSGREEVRRVGVGEGR